MTGRVLVVRHLNRSGYPVGQAEYAEACGCAATITRQSRREYGTPLVVADEAVYTLHDGGTERHRLVWRDAYVCAGAACVQQDRRSA